MFAARSVHKAAVVTYVKSAIVRYVNGERATAAKR
jgi:hypothetical protein